MQHLKKYNTCLQIHLITKIILDELILKVCRIKARNCIYTGENKTFKTANNWGFFYFVFSPLYLRLFYA